MGEPVVHLLVAGPSVFICDECVDLCVEICSEKRRKARERRAIEERARLIIFGADSDA